VLADGRPPKPSVLGLKLRNASLEEVRERVIAMVSASRSQSLT
jgi:hypothetical protein